LDPKVGTGAVKNIGEGAPNEQTVPVNQVNPVLQDQHNDSNISKDEMVGGSELSEDDSEEDLGDQDSLISIFTFLLFMINE